MSRLCAMRKITGLIMLLIFCRVIAHSQCLVSSLVINTGYNSVTGTSITGSPEGGTSVPDPHWKLTAVTPSIAVGIAATPISGLVEVVSGNSADVLQAPSVVIEYPYSNWISCVNSDIYVTDGTGPPPAGTTYSMTLSRCFKTCSADSIKLDLNIADDNYISSMDIDGIVTSFSQPVSMSTANWSSFAHYITTLWLPGGSHCINIVVQNYNTGAVGENGFELNVYGTVSSTTANIYSEDTSCASYVCSSTIPCVTTALNISTGYDPVAGALVTPTVLDPKWTSTVSPATADSVAADAGILGCYDIVPLPPPYWSLSGSSCNWISSQNTTSYNTDGSGADIYWMKLTRPFNTCVSDSLILNMNIESDDWISEIDFDGAPVFSPGVGGCGSTSYTSYVYHLGMVTAGAHSVSVVVHNCNNGYYENSTGMALYGTVNSASGTASITTENNPSGPTCSCLTTIPPCNTLALADSAQTCDSSTVALSATVTGADSIVNIHWLPGTGLSDTAILNPSLSVGTASGYYYLTVESLQPGNLVFNGDFSLGDTAFTSAYPYVSGAGSLVPAGVFAITTDPHLDHPGAASFGDHTTGTGNMMAINGASAPIDVWCQTISVTPNTYYDFSAWFANWSADTTDNLPVIEFEIDGVSMGGPFSFPHADGAWTQYANSWYSGTNTTATICIHDSVTAASGNDFAIDDISFRQLCIAKDSIYVQVNHMPNAHLGNDTAICTGNAATLKPVTIAGGDLYAWSTGAVTDSISISTTGNYWVSINNHGCLASDTINVQVYSSAVNLGDDTAICIGQSVTLQSSDPYTIPVYLWSTGAATATISISAAGSYWLTVTQGGCIGSDTLTVSTIPVPVVYLGPDTAVCNGVPIELQSLFTYTGATYLWNNGSTAPDINIVTSGIYELSVSIGGCTGSDSIAVGSKNGTLVLQNNDTAICRGASIQVLADDSVTATYQWLPTAGMPFSNIADPVITPDTSAMYILSATVAGCPPLQDSFYIDVQPNPIAVFIGGNRMVCHDDTLHINASVNPGWYTHYSYNWSPATYIDYPTSPDIVFAYGDTTTLILTVSTPAGCIGKDSAQIFVHSNDFLQMPPLGGICPGDSAQLIVTSTELGTTAHWYPPIYLSDSLSLTPWIFPITSQGYSVVGVSQYGCLDTVSIGVTVYPNAIMNLPDSVTLYPGESYQMDPVTNCTTLSWFPALGLSDTHITNPVAMPDVNTMYIVHGTTEEGCIVIDSIHVIVDPTTLLAIPNAFTPGNGPNNVIKVIKRGIATLHYFRIYNRWGNMVFETSDINAGWDGTYKGKPQSQDVFVYEVEAVTNTGEIFVQKGNITLLR